MMTASPDKLDLLRAHFFNRTDRIAAMMPWGKPHPIEGGNHLEGLLSAHILGDEVPKAQAWFTNKRGSRSIQKGRFKLGSYAPCTKGNTRWLCLDFDGQGHANDIADPTAAVLSAHNLCAKEKLDGYIERSGGGHGWHLWVFFSEPLPAKLARRLGFILAPEDAPLVSGGYADARRAKGIEIFPKQSRVKKGGGYGSMVWLPWWSGSKGGASQFHRLEGSELVPFTPQMLTPVDRPTVEEVCKKYGKKPTKATRSKPAPQIADEDLMAILRQADEEQAQTQDSTDPSPNPMAQSWADWRTKVAAVLPLEKIYGPYLTGNKSGDGWLECRDPASPTGDRTPSAGVADGTGKAARGTFSSFRSGTTLSVFDFMVAHGQAKDFKEAVRKVASYTSIPTPDSRRASGSSPANPTTTTLPNPYPQIVVNKRQVRETILDAQAILRAANARKPTLFKRSGRVVRIVNVDNRLEIETLDETAMYGVLLRIADWVRETDDGTYDSAPAHEVSRDMITNVDPELPNLDAVITAPVLDQHGNIVATPGYHRESGLWYHKTPNFDLPPIPANPTDLEVAQAKSLILDHLLVDFPFVGQSDRAHAVALLFLPFVRRMIKGPTPIHLVEAPSVGSGKSLLADVIHRIATGTEAEVTTMGRDDEETRKKITSVLSAGKPIVLIDNIKTALDSADLAAAITSEIWQDRLLGQTKIIWLPNRSVWVVTGNNPNLSLEIARRCVRIRILPKEERPWLRDNFKHPQLKLWVGGERVRLAHAVLVCLSVWIARGLPVGTATLGSFESWAQVMGGILDTIGIPGFLEDTDALYESADLEGHEWREFVDEWWDIYGRDPVPAGDLLHLARERSLLLSVLGSKSERSQAIRLGKALSANRDRQFNGRKIEVASKFRNQNLWKLVAQGDEQEDDTCDGDQQGMFAAQKIGRVDDIHTNSHTDIHQKIPAPSLGNMDVEDVGDVSLSYAQGDPNSSNQNTYHVPRAHKKGPENIPTPPHIHNPKEDRIVNPGDMGVEVDFRYPHVQNLNSKPREVDLADFTEEADREEL
jgi:hypothetical protein